MHLGFSILAAAVLHGPPKKGPNKFEIHAFKNVFFLQKAGQKRKQFEGPLRTFVTAVTRSPGDLNNTNNHMSGPVFSCNLHIKLGFYFHT